MELFQELSLQNNLVVQIWDTSRPIAADTTKVAVKIIVKVNIRPDYFDNHEDFTLVRNVFGSEITYTHEKERTFVHTPDKDSVFTGLIEDFKRDSLHYIARTTFPHRFVHSKLRDIRERPHRYRQHTGTTA